MQLLVRNAVRDFDTWRAYLKQDTAAAAEYGLTLERLWRSQDDPNVAFFLFEVEDRDRAEAFMARPESAEIGQASGVLEGEAYFIQALPLD